MKVAILRGFSGAKKRHHKKAKHAKKAKRSGGRAAQRARFKAAANRCKDIVVEQIRKSTGKQNPFKLTGACMRTQLRK